MIFKKVIEYNISKCKSPVNTKLNKSDVTIEKATN